MVFVCAQGLSKSVLKFFGNRYGVGRIAYFLAANTYRVSRDHDMGSFQCGLNGHPTRIEGSSVNGLLNSMRHQSVGRHWRLYRHPQRLWVEASASCTENWNDWGDEDNNGPSAEGAPMRLPR